MAKPTASALAKLTAMADMLSIFARLFIFLSPLVTSGETGSFPVEEFFSHSQGEPAR